MKPSPPMTDHALEPIKERIANLTDWLRDNAPYCAVDQNHLNDNNVERAYWHYGYLVALRDALGLIERDQAALSSTPPRAHEEQREGVEEIVASIENGGALIVSGSPGPLYTAGYSAGARMVAKRLREAFPALVAEPDFRTSQSPSNSQQVDAKDAPSGKRPPSEIVWRLCAYTRQDEKCQRCPSEETYKGIEGCVRGCYALAEEAVNIAQTGNPWRKKADPVGAERVHDNPLPNSGLTTEDLARFEDLTADLDALRAAKSRLELRAGVYLTALEKIAEARTGHWLDLAYERREIAIAAIASAEKP